MGKSEVAGGLTLGFKGEAGPRHVNFGIASLFKSVKVHETTGEAKDTEVSKDRGERHLGLSPGEHSLYTAV